MGQIKVEIKVDEALTYTFLEADGLIEGFTLKRSMDDDLGALCGKVECGEVNLTFSNLFNEFNITSPTSPYSQIKNGQELRVYSVLESGTYTLFTGEIVDFVAPTSTSTQTCNVRAVDRLHALLNRDTTTNPNIQIDKSKSLFDYISILFVAYGLTEDDFEIDEDLKQIFLDYSILSGQTLSTQFNEICSAADAYIYVNRVGRVIVKEKRITGTSVRTYTRTDSENYLVNSEFGNSLFSSYNTLKVGYIATKLSDTTCLLSIENQAIQAGDNRFENYQLNISNLYEIDSIKVISSSDTIVTSLSATSSTISFTLSNPTSSDDIVAVEVYGKTVETADAFIVKEIDSGKVKQGLEVKSLLVQSKEVAEGLAEKLYVRASQSVPYIKAEVEVRDFDVDLAYIVSVIDEEAELSYEGYIHSIDVEYDGQGFSYYHLGIKALFEEVADDDE